MLAVVMTSSMAAIFYSAATAVVRYLYVRSSTQVNIQEVLKKDSFIFKSIFVVECCNLFNIGTFYFQSGTSEFEGRSVAVLYQACLESKQEYSMPLYKLMPLNHLLMSILVIVNVSCNIFLYRFLKRQTATSTARTEMDRKKDRKRNLVPAKTGIINLAIYVISVTFFFITYSHKSATLDSATRAFILAAYSDFFHCIVAPVIIISGSSEARKKVFSLLSILPRKLMDTLKFN